MSSTETTLKQAVNFQEVREKILTLKRNIHCQFITHRDYIMKRFIHTVSCCLLYYFHISTASHEIKSFELHTEGELTHHYGKSSLINFTIGVQNTGPSTQFNITFFASKSTRHVYFNNSRFEYCHLGHLNVTIYIDNSTVKLTETVDLEFPNKTCCEMAASLCIDIQSQDITIRPIDDRNHICRAYNHDVNDNEGAGYKDCEGTDTDEDGIGIMYWYIIIICTVCGFVVVVVLAVVVYVCCRKKIQNEDKEDGAVDIPIEPLSLSIDLRKQQYRMEQSPSFISKENGPPLQTNLPSMDSFFFGSNSSLPQPEERLPQEFLSAFMRKYVEFVTEWNKSAPKDKTAPYVFSQSEVASATSGGPTSSRALLPKDRRISIKRRKGKGVSAIYVNQWDSSMELPREHVKFVEKVGEGQFGEVHKATLQRDRTSMTVAVKQLKKGTSMDDRNNFLRELATHALLEDHPHVIKLIGCCIEKEPILVIFEYMANGNLLDYLKNTPESVPTALHYVVTFGHHVAQGMEFLAETEIIHRDLAARNILINVSGVCKVADFGFAKDVFGVTKYTKKLQTAPIRWMAPESLVDGIFSTQSDVWSFGVLLWEIVTLGRELPYFDIRSINIKTQLKEGMRLRKPGHCPSDLYALMDMCWQAEPEERPTFERLCKEFVDLEHFGHYTPGSRTSHARKASMLRGLYNKITRQMSSDAN